MRTVKITSLLHDLFLIILLASCGPAAPASQTALPSATQPSATEPSPATQAPPATQPTNATEAPSSQPEGTATTPPRQILIEAPASGATVSSPVEVRGWVSVSPFEATLRWRVYDAAGQVVGEGPIMVNAEMGQPGNFDGQSTFSVSAGGPGRIELAELSAKDGSVVVSASVDVVLVAQPHQILIDAPLAGATVSSPVEVRGTVSVSPFESTLRGRVYDAAGQVVGEGPIMVDAEMGQPGSFAGKIPFTVNAGGPGKVEIADISAKDGSVIASASVDVILAGSSALSPIEIPAAGAQAVLPLHVLARVGQPGEQAKATLTWQDGTVLENQLSVLSGEDGKGLVIGSVDWMMEGPLPQPPSQLATLAIYSQGGQLLAEQRITMLSADDPNVRTATLYFLLGEDLQATQRHIVRTEAIGTAALNELLWGPPPNNLAGFGTAIPTPEEVLLYAGRGADWGPRVRLLRLTIVDGLATADFSKEIQAYGGGSLRVKLIHDQIVMTLLQFSTVREVVIAVEGQTEGVLQP
jgi:Immunoglobulin-like domain of bacterial spore germination/Sporulation and spore germination